jgi:hypothetical protein
LQPGTHFFVEVSQYCASGQEALVRHPATHWPPSQILPATQPASSRRPTLHWRARVSQILPVEQSASSVQPGLQVLLARSQ